MTVRAAVRRAGPVEVASGAAVTVGVAALTVIAPEHAAPIMVGVVIVVAALVAAFADPVYGLSLVVLASFLRAAVSVPEPVALALVLAVASVAVAVSRRRAVVPALGAVEAVMLAYLGWNLLSWVQPHELPAPGSDMWVLRYLLTGTVLPFVLYVLGRTVVTDERSADRLLWLVAALGGYSALVGVLQFHGPAWLVWPRYVVADPAWTGRASGVVDQPVVNGLLLALTVPVCLLLAHRPFRPRWARSVLVGVALVATYGVYLTHTRAAWVAYLLVVIVLVVYGGRGPRRWGIGLLTAIAVLAVTNLAVLAGTDREAGGVASTNEIKDRLNMIATGWWGVAQRPVEGWGVGRFSAVNTVFHRQWSPGVEWERGYGFVAHENATGIAADLGIVGLALWVAVLVLVVRRVWAAVRCGSGDRGPSDALALVALLGLLGYLVCGFTVDLRFLDFANGLVFLLAGAALGGRVPAPTGVGP